MATAADKARAGIRAWVREAGRLAGAGLRAATPYSVPDGKTLAIGSPDWVVVLWGLEPADVTRRLCAVIAPDARNDGAPVPTVCR